MNRLIHFLHAKTQYGLHSPFVYRLYTEVLFSRSPGHGHSFPDVVWRLEEYYGHPHTTDTLSAGHYQLSTNDGAFLILDHPHRDESHWRSLVAAPEWQVTIDLFTVGIAVANPRLSKQHFLLH